MFREVRKLTKAELQLVKLLLADHIGGLDPGKCRCSWGEVFEAKRRSCEAFVKPIVAFNNIVEKLRANGIDFERFAQALEDLVYLFDSGRVALALVSCDPFRDAIVVDCIGEEFSCNRRVSLIGKHEIKGLPAAIFGAM